MVLTKLNALVQVKSAVLHSHAVAVDIPAVLARAKPQMDQPAVMVKNAVVACALETNVHHRSQMERPAVLIEHAPVIIALLEHALAEIMVLFALLVLLAVVITTARDLSALRRRPGVHVVFQKMSAKVTDAVGLSASKWMECTHEVGHYICKKKTCKSR